MFVPPPGIDPSLLRPPARVDFDRLFNEVYPALHRYCQRLTGDADAGEDAAQEAFVRFVRHDIEAPPPAARVWLFRTATHLIRDRFRVRENRRRLLEANPVAPAAAPDPGREVERDETVATVRRVLDSIPARDRQLLLMREEGFSYKEMAGAVGVKPGSVGTLLARAQDRFTTALDRDDPEVPAEHGRGDA